MLASLARYLVIGLLLGSARVAATVTSPPSTTFYLISLGLAVAAFFVKKQMVRPVLPGSLPAEIKESLGSFRSGHLVSYVLFEGVGLVGFVAFFLGGSRIQFINLLVVAFALMVLLRPKRIYFLNL